MPAPRRICVLLGLLAVGLLVVAPAGATGKHPSCGGLVSKKLIEKINGEKAVELSKPSSTFAVGDWVEGPRSSCSAGYYIPDLPPGEITEASAFWGLGFGLTAAQWNKIKNKEGGPTTIEGTGPWSRQTVKVNRPGTHAFIATTTALVAPGEEPTHYLYVLTKKSDLFYLEIDRATPGKLTGIAAEVLQAHPEL